MTRKRFNFPFALSVNFIHELTDSEKHYLTHVLRLKVGDRVDLLDGRGRMGVGILESTPYHRLALKVVSVEERRGNEFSLIFCPSLTKGTKMDFMVQKTTELGVAEIAPFVSRRSVSRPRDMDLEKKAMRWERIAREAVKQSGRAFVPKIWPVVDFLTLIDRGFPPGYLPLIFWEGGGKHLKEVLDSNGVGRPRGAMVVVGPEGGFDEEEVRRAEEKGFIPVWLGHHVLRAETAALVVCALIQFLLGDFFTPEGIRCMG